MLIDGKERYNERKRTERKENYRASERSNGYEWLGD